MALLPVKSVRAGRETITFKLVEREREREFVRGKMDVQTVKRKQSTNTHCHYLTHTHTLQINTFSALCSVCCDIYWEATAPLTSPIDRPAFPLRLTGMSAGRECVCLCWRGTFKRQSVVSWSVYGLISPSECLYSEV